MKDEKNKGGERERVEEKNGVIRWWRNGVVSPPQKEKIVVEKEKAEKMRERERIKMNQPNHSFSHTHTLSFTHCV